VFDLVIFTCPTNDAATVRFEHKVPVWRYRYFGEFPNTRLTMNPDSGAYHESEISTVFQTANDTSGQEDTPEELSISNFMNKVWADFAKDPEHAFTRIYGWPKYNPNGELIIFHRPLLPELMRPLEPTLIYFAVDNITEPMIVSPDNTDLSCPIIQSQLGAIGGTNALTENPEGFTAQFGPIADELTGLVGIGQSNHGDAPFGPPPIAPPVPASLSAVVSSISASLPTATSVAADSEGFPGRHGYR
jgi:hypothetical protein